MRVLKKTLISLLCLVLTAGAVYGNGIDYREEMRRLVIDISQYAKIENPFFQIIPQNGQEVLTLDGEADGLIHTEYQEAIDAIGREDLFYGYRRDNRKTPDRENEYLLEWCELYKNNDIPVLVTDYCSSRKKMSDSYSLNGRNGFISFAAPERELNEIPSFPDPLPGENGGDISSVGEARNFLYLINGEKYRTKADFIDALEKTDYDLIIMDLFHSDEVMQKKDLERIRYKQNGGKRLLSCYMSIGEAEDYRFYWDAAWDSSAPRWLEEENSNWVGNFKVRYWDEAWKSILFGNPDAYLDRILVAGFDGIYLDIIDAFEYFE